jgi:hypothetical protein
MITPLPYTERKRSTRKVRSKITPSPGKDVDVPGITIDETAKSWRRPIFVIPAQAGIQELH